jgi:four helix bundle protein
MAHKVEELDTWKLCNELVDRVAAATSQPRVAQDRKFCEQINDAAGDALSDCAEGFARFYPSDHATFLGYALASLEEVRTRAALGHKRKHFDDQTTSNLINLCFRAEKAIKRLRAYLWSVDKKNLPPRPTVPANPRRPPRRRRKRP